MSSAPRWSQTSGPAFVPASQEAFFSTFAAFVLSLNDASDQVQSPAVLTAFPHLLTLFSFFKTTFRQRLWVWRRNYTFTSARHFTMFSIMYLFILNYFKYSYFILNGAAFHHKCAAC